MLLKGNVLITGTSNGIGLATAKLFLDLGYTVYGIDKSQCPDDLQSRDSYYHLQCDIVDIKHFVSAKHLSTNVDFEFIVNNAGTDNPENAISVNLTSLFDIEDMFVSTSTKCVVNICSTSAHIGIENREYVASKGGVLSYTRQLAKTMAAWGGRCVSVSPGPVLTSMNDHIIFEEKKLEAVANENILNKWIDPLEIAQAIYFMCNSPSITGVDLLIDCGEHINQTEIK